MAGRRWQPPDPVPARDEPRRPGDPSPLGAALDRVLGGLGAPPADALAAVFERWPELAGLPLADHAAPVALTAGVLTVRVDDPAWATELRYRQGEVLQRCDAVIGTGLVGRIETRVGPPKNPQDSG